MIVCHSGVDCMPPYAVGNTHMINHMIVSKRTSHRMLQYATIRWQRIHIRSTTWSYPYEGVIVWRPHDHHIIICYLLPDYVRLWNIPYDLIVWLTLIMCSHNLILCSPDCFYKRHIMIHFSRRILSLAGWSREVSSLRFWMYWSWFFAQIEEKNNHW